MCFLAASALRIYTIISVIFHEGPQFVELGESLVHLVRDKSRTGSFQKRKTTRSCVVFFVSSSSNPKFSSLEINPTSTPARDRS